MLDRTADFLLYVSHYHIHDTFASRKTGLLQTVSLIIIIIFSLSNN